MGSSTGCSERCLFVHDLNPNSRLFSDVQWGQAACFFLLKTTPDAIDRSLTAAGSINLNPNIFAADVHGMAAIREKPDAIYVQPSR
jgi:hypothetical protein